MKTITSLLPIVLFALLNRNTHAQTITVQDCIKYFQNKSLTSINESLIHKGWENNQIDGFTISSDITWSYQINDYSERAKGWFSIACFDGNIDRIQYQVQNESSKNTFSKSIKSAGFKETGSYVEDGELVTEYANDKYTLSYHVSYSESDYDYSNMTVHLFEMIRKFGLYDSENGEQLVFHDGDDYVEERTYYVNGKKNGYSRTFDEFGTQTAEFTYKDDQLNGPFQTFTAAGEIESKGNYINGLLNGEFTVFDNETGIKTVTMMLNGKKNGLSYSELNGRIIAKGEFLNDLRIGQWLENFSNAENETGLPDFFVHANYVAGSREENAYFTSFTSSDTLFILPFKNDQINGEAIYFVEYSEFKGQIREKTQFVDGEKEGLSTVFFEEAYEGDGYFPVKATYNYSNGKRNGKSYFEVENDQILEGSYSNDEKEGEWKETYFTDGKTLVNTGKYALGQEHGEWRRNTNGELSCISQYYYGSLQNETYYEDDSKTIAVDYTNYEPVRFTKYSDDKIDAIIENKNGLYTSKRAQLTVNSKGDIVEKYQIQLPTNEDLSDEMYNQKVELILEILAAPEKNKTNYASGEFSISTPKELVKGSYTDKTITGSFSIEFKTLNGLRYNCSYFNSKPQNELFSYTNGTNFEGELTIDFLKQNVKVKNGLRNGATEYFDESGKVMKKEKYKDGVLKE